MEKRVTLAQVNLDLRLAGIENTELVRGKGYFYFAAIDATKPFPMQHAMSTSVMTTTLGHGNVDRSAWLHDARRIVAESKERAPIGGHTETGGLKITLKRGE